MGQHINSLKNKSVKFLALGDSYTIGEKVPLAKSWPYQLQQYLNTAKWNIKAPEIIATTGWTTNELIDAIKQKNLETTYDLVTLLIGVNNEYRQYPLNQYIKEFEQLLQMAIAFAQGINQHVIVLSIPDYSVTPFAKNKDPEKIAHTLKEYNKINHAIAKKYGVHYVNITPISLEAEHDLSLIAEDHLHPSEKMYYLWTKAIIREVFPQNN